jgi:hypothetical protein
MPRSAGARALGAFIEKLRFATQLAFERGCHSSMSIGIFGRLYEIMNSIDIVNSCF